MDKGDVTIDVVSCLVREQFPEWSALPIEPVLLDGWDNTTFRLGSGLSVRLPSADRYVAQVDKEQRWLPFLSANLPLPTPVPVARGEPGCGFPRPWSIHRWVEGDVAALSPVRDAAQLADDVAAFLSALHEVPVGGGPAAGPHSFGRGGPVAAFDDATRRMVERLRGRIDADVALEVWDAALDAPSTSPDVWVHGDVTPSNLLVREHRLCGVIDFGCAAVGDPACDLTMAWTVFEGASRRRFVDAVPVDESAWRRARGWALWKAALDVPVEPDDGEGDGTRFGWRWTPLGVIEQLVAEHRAHRAA